VWTLEADEGTFELLVIVITGFGTMVLFSLLLLVRRVSREKHWPIVKQLLLKYDKFHEEHFVFSEDDDEGGNSKRRIAGVIATITFVIAGAAMVRRAHARVASRAGVAPLSSR
jgi:hypothetical protein